MSTQARSVCARARVCVFVSFYLQLHAEKQTKARKL